jgi:hypothetical protein
VRTPWFTAGSVRFVATSFMVAVAAAGLVVSLSPATASATGAMSAGSMPVLTTGGGLSNLYGVAATSASSAWAVGIGESGQALILRLSGQLWTKMPGPAV